MKIKSLPLQCHAMNDQCKELTFILGDVAARLVGIDKRFKESHSRGLRIGSVDSRSISGCIQWQTQHVLLWLLVMTGLLSFSQSGTLPLC